VDTGLPVFTARCYAQRVYSVARCHVHPSVHHDPVACQKTFTFHQNFFTNYYSSAESEVARI